MNKNEICIEMMIQFKEEYLKLVNEEKDLKKICEEKSIEHGYNNKKKEVVVALSNLRTNQFFQQNTLNKIGETFIKLYKKI
jgi:hypothetical protein